MAAIDLTTLAAVESFLALGAGNTDEAVLSTLITAASQLIATYCGRVFQVASYAERRNGPGAREMMLANVPITAVTSVTINGTTVPAGDPVATRGWFIDDPPTDRSAMLYLNGHTFARGIQNVTVAYSAGYATIPADLAQACIELVALRYKERPHFDLASKGMAGETTTFVVKDLKPSTKTVLDLYRRKTPVPGMSDPDIKGLDRLILRLRTMPESVRASLRRAVTAESDRVTQRVQEKLQGPVLRERTHSLHNSIHPEVTETPNSVIGIVGTNVRYAAFHEYGFHGTETVRAHTRRVSMAFGRPIPTVIASVRAHTRRVDYPARSFLRSTLAEMAPEIRARLEAAVAEGMSAAP